MQNKLNIVFMGTPDFALPSLELLDKTHNVTAVFCQPDKINGRGNKINFCPIKEYALQKSIQIFQPETFKNEACLELLQKLNPDLIVVAAYGKILPKYVLDMPKYGCINVHGSLLPLYRGASPIQSAILNGDKETGITIMYMSEGLDCGDIILQQKTEIGEYETAGELFDKMSVIGAQVLLKAIDMLINGTATRLPQDNAKSSHVKMIDKSMGKIDFSKSAKKIKQLVYGLNPWPSAYIESQSGLVKIHKVILGNATNRPYGEIISVTKKGIEVSCGDGNTLIITEIQRQGKKIMDAYSFSLGMHIKAGMAVNSL